MNKNDWDKKLTDSTLKRITKSDNKYEDVHITDVPSNVISNGTNITDSVLENINYKDDNKLNLGWEELVELIKSWFLWCNINI